MRSLLPQLLDLHGVIVTLNAIHCQTETAQTIIDPNADDTLNVKANQRNLYKYLVSTSFGPLFLQRKRAIVL